MTRRDPRFRDLPLAARLLTIAAIVAAVAASAPSALGRPVDLTLLALTAALCVGASSFEVSRPGSSSLHPGVVFVFWGAVLLPAWAVALLAVLSFGPSLLRGRVRWYAPTFHAAACVLAGLAVQAILSVTPGELATGPVGVAALGLAALTFVFTVDALLTVHMRVAWHRPLRIGARNLAVNVPVDVALVTTGAALAVMWSYEPWMCVIFAGPLGLVSRAMLVPALRHKSQTDPKTGLFNFQHLHESLDDALRVATRRDDSVALVMIDLDHLRTVNNRFGHLAGDQAILRVARGLARAAHERGIAARFGGEEFCLLLPDWTAAQAEALVDAVREEIQDLAWTSSDGETMRCSFSAGVAAFPKDAEDADALIAAADAALYDAKAGGRNRVRLALAPLARETLDAATEAAPIALQPPPDPVAPPVALVPDHTDDEQAHGDDEPPARRYIPAFVALLLAGLVAVLFASGPLDSVDSPILLLLLVAAVVLLDVVRIDLFEGLNLSAASVPTLSLACVFGPVGPIAAEVAIAMLRLARGEPRIKWSFDLGALGLAGAAAAVTFAVMPTGTPLQQIFAGIPAALAYYAVNTGLMSVVVAMAEGRRPLDVWREGMAWLWAHFVVYGVIGAALAVSYEHLGPITVFLFALPVATLWLGQRGYVHRSRASVVELRRHRDDLETANRRLQRLLDEKRDLVGRMHGSYLSTITSLARTIEAKDPYTGGHVERVAKVTMLLADELGLPATQRRAAEVGATIHDIGKIGVPDSILLKPARLSDEELAVMRRHPETSSYIVGELDVPRVVKEMVRSHHERYDGRGYPDGLAGEEIPLSARILAVADTLDAMTSDRPYRAARGLDDAIDEIRSLAGSQFCPAVVAALDACLARDATLAGLFRGRSDRFGDPPLAMAAG